MPIQIDLERARSEVQSLVERVASGPAETLKKIERHLQTGPKVESVTAELAGLVVAMNEGAERINDAVAELRELRKTTERRRALLTWLPITALLMSAGLAGWTAWEMYQVKESSNLVAAWMAHVSQQMGPPQRSR